MFSKLNEVKDIVVDVHQLANIVNAIKKKQKNIRLTIDYKTKILYVQDGDMLYTLQGRM
jgi:3'-phosphoadenosine 5'-phosphosulfate sulfotransferase